MKFTPSFVKGCITTPTDEIAVLETVDGGQCRYSITYNINPFICAREQAFQVKIHVADKPYAGKVEPAFNTTAAAFAANKKPAATSPEKTLEMMLTRSSRIKDSIRGARLTNYLLTFNSDVTAHIPNDLAYLLSSKTIASSGGVPIKSKKSYKIISNDDLAAKSLSAPRLERFIQPGSESTPPTILAATGDSRNIGIRLLFEQGVDPADAFMKENAVTMAPVTHGGVRKKDPTTKSTALQQQFVTTLVRDNKVPTPSSSVRVIPVLESENTLSITEMLSIPLDIVGTADFYLVFELVNSSGLVVEKIIRNVEHHKLLSLVQTPVIEPTVFSIAAAKPGQCVFQIQQNDPMGIGVAVYRKIWYADTPNSVSTGYSLVGRQPLLFGEKRVVEDSVSNINPVVYRVVPYGRDEQLGSVFGSTVTHAREIINNKKKNVKSGFITMSYQNTSEGVELTIKDIPPGVVSVEVYRKDFRKLTQQNELIDTPFFIGNEKTTTIRAVDANVVQGRVYEYSCVLVYKEGSRVAGTTTLVVDYVLETAGFLSTFITGTKVIKTGGVNYDCIFELQTDFLEKDESLIRKALEKAGALSYFQGDITRDKLQLATAYKFIRTNLTTGEVEDLGVGTSTSFRDSTYSTVKGAKPIEAGYEYSYKVLTHFRTPDSIVQGATQNVIRQKILGTDGLFTNEYDYTYEPYRWQHPMALNEGTLTSPSSLKKNHTKNDFTFGAIGASSETTISLLDMLPSILEAKAYKLNSRINKIEWKLSGAASKIDHFIIALEVDGMRSVVGKAHSFSETNLFRFIDYLDNGEKGVLSYVIIPVHYDFSKGREAKTNYVVV